MAVRTGLTGAAAINVLIVLPVLLISLIRGRECVSWPAVRVALHPTRGDREVRWWLTSLTLTTSGVFAIAAEYTGGH